MSTKFNKQTTHTKFLEDPPCMNCYVACRWTDRQTDRKKEGRTDGQTENMKML